MNIEIDIDYREKDIITLFESVAKTNKTNIKFNVCNLIIGDFIIKNEEGILFIIERKSISDLCASIIDGRHTEQKNRLIDSIQDSKKIIYIIEGKKISTQRITKNTINSSILNLIFKHKYNVIFTESKEDTVDNIVLLYNKLVNNKLEIEIEISSKINVIKKSDKINDNIFINMICVIPGISVKIAIKIHEKYKTLNDIIIAYNLIEHENDKKKMLSEIYITSNRKLGKVLSEKIYNSIFNEFIPKTQLPKIKTNKKEGKNNQNDLIECLL